MNIKEINNNKIVKKIQMKCDNYKTDIDGKFMIPRNGFYIISGSAGSGKTNLLISMLSGKKDDLLNSKFDKVHYFSPSIHTLGRDLNLPPERIHSEFSKELLEEVIEDEKLENEELIEDGDEPNQILYVFDDLVVELKKKENMNALLKLIYNRRHMNAYIIILTQKFNLLPLKLRISLAGNKGALIMFKSINKKETESIREELLDLNPHEFKQLTNYVFDESYNFLYIRFDLKQENMYHKNFNNLKVELKE